MPRKDSKRLPRHKRYLETVKRDRSMTSLAMMVLREPDSADLADLMIYFQVSAISLRTYSVLEQAGREARGPEKAMISAMTWR